MIHRNVFKVFALILGYVTVFAACDRDESNSEDDLISEQIIARICEANAKLLAENEISVTFTTIDYLILGTTLRFEHKLEVNLSAKKSLAVQKVADAYKDFYYYDETAHYRFQSKTDTEPENYISSKISTGYWKYYVWDLPYLQDERVKTMGKWKEEDGKFVVDYPYAGDVEKYVGSKWYVTLSENNKYLKLELKAATGESLETSDYSYVANPVFPAGYQPDQFPAINQYSVNVNWGGTYGTDTYYTNDLWADENLKYFAISYYSATPKVAGKMPLFYYDEARTQLILDDLDKTNFYADYDYDKDTGYYWFFNGKLSSEADGTTVYAQWEDEKTVYDKYGNE